MNKNENMIILSDEEKYDMEKFEYKINDNEKQFVVKSEDSIEYIV